MGTFQLVKFYCISVAYKIVLNPSDCSNLIFWDNKAALFSISEMYGMKTCIRFYIQLAFSLTLRCPKLCFQIKWKNLIKLCNVINDEIKTYSNIVKFDVQHKNWQHWLNANGRWNWLSISIFCLFRFHCLLSVKSLLCRQLNNVVCLLLLLDVPKSEIPFVCFIFCIYFTVAV